MYIYIHSFSISGSVLFRIFLFSLILAVSFICLLLTISAFNNNSEFCENSFKKIF